MSRRKHSLSVIGTPVAAARTEADTIAFAGPYTITVAEFQAVRDLIYKVAGISLSDTKRQLVCTRLSKRLRYFGLQTFSEYLDYLKTQDHHGNELLQLTNCLTTNKTEFFREAHHFDFLRHQIIPQVREMQPVGGHKRLRLWSAGCSTGEEAYSLAISVYEELGSLAGWDVKILASDIDTNVLQHAETGWYAEESLARVQAPMLQKYFTRDRHEREHYLRVRPELRDLIVFRRINLNDPGWPIRTKFDAIFCRNVVIYFDRETQRGLIRRFATFLQPEGYFFAGHSESLFGLTDQFTPLKRTVYRLRSHQRVSSVVTEPRADS